MLKWIRSAAALLLLCAQAHPASARGDKGLSDLNRALSRSGKKLSKSLGGTVCVMDFSETGEAAHTSEFGQLAAEMLSGRFLEPKGRRYTLVDRRQLINVMRDSVIFGDSSTIDRLRKETGMDTLVSGTYADLGKEISLTIKVVSAKNGAVTASFSVRIGKSLGLEKMLGHRYPVFGAISASSGTAKAAETGDALDVDLGIFYEGGDGRLYPLREGMVLTSKDNYAIYVKPQEDCFLYVYQVDGMEKVEPLFPNVRFSDAANPLKVGREYWLPNRTEFFFLDDVRGREEIYLFATRSRAMGLENIREIAMPEIREAVKTMGVGGARASESVTKIRGTKGNAMDLIVRKLQSRGDFYYKLSFIHQ